MRALHLVRGHALRVCSDYGQYMPIDFLLQGDGGGGGIEATNL